MIVAEAYEGVTTTLSMRPVGSGVTFELGLGCVGVAGGVDGGGAGVTGVEGLGFFDGFGLVEGFGVEGGLGLVMSKLPPVDDAAVPLTLALLKLTVALPAAFALNVTLKIFAIPLGAGERDAVKPMDAEF